MCIEVMFLPTLWNYISTIWNIFLNLCFTGCCFESLRKCSFVLIAVYICSLHVNLKKRLMGGCQLFPVNIIYFNEKAVTQSSLTHGKQTTCYSIDFLALFKSQGIN